MEITPYKGATVEAETGEAIILWWISPGGGKRVRFRIGFEEWIEFVDGIRWSGIMKGVEKDWMFFGRYQRRMRLPLTGLA